MSLRRALACLLVPVLLGGCAVPPAAPTAPGVGLLSGRLLVKVDGQGNESERSLSATFELRGNASTGSLDLSTPLGTVLAQARWSPGQAVLTTPQGESRFDDIDSLTRELLGESVPVMALFDWLRGRPWPGASSGPMPPASPPGFQQLGWSINLARFDEAWVAAHRETPPVVTLRAKLDRP